MSKVLVTVEIVNVFIISKTIILINENRFFFDLYFKNKNYKISINDQLYLRNLIKSVRFL